MTDIMNNIDLVRKIAWRVTKRSSVWEFDDVFSEACVAYLEGEKHFDPSKGVAKSTYLWTYINNHLINCVLDTQRKFTDREATVDVYELQITARLADPVGAYFAEAAWEDFYENLSAPAREICDILLDEGTGYLPIDKPKLCRGKVRDELRARGYSWSVIWDSYRELRQALAYAAVGA